MIAHWLLQLKTGGAVGSTTSIVAFRTVVLSFRELYRHFFMLFEKYSQVLFLFPLYYDLITT